MDYSIQEIIKSFTGKSNDNTPKAAIALSLEMHKGSTGEEKEMSTISLFNPELKLMRLGKFIVLDIVFINNYDIDLRQSWSVLEHYGKVNTETDEDTSYILSTMIVPTEYEGTIYALLLNPIYWSLQTPITGEKPNSIRILFEEDHFGIYKNEGVDIESIKKAVDKQIEMEQQQLAQIQARKEEEEAYRRERDEKLEELRRSGFKGE